MVPLSEAADLVDLGGLPVQRVVRGQAYRNGAFKHEMLSQVYHQILGGRHFNAYHEARHLFRKQEGLTPFTVINMRKKIE
jgi:hypothetical protein